MAYDEALSRYRQDRFTDQDVIRCTGLSVRTWRELIRLKAVRTEAERYGRGPGRVRTCDAHTLKRAAVISALHRSGLSLAVAGQIAYVVPFHTLLYVVCDPLTILFQQAGREPNTELPPRRQRPMADWFDPIKPAIAEPDTDWLIEIFDGRFIGVRYDARKGPVTIFGDLREQATRFIAWLPFLRRDQFAGGAIERMAQEVRGASFVKFIADYEDPSKWLKGLHGLGYRFENHDGEADALRVAAESAVRNPIFTTTVNVTLAVRKALRRYLGIEPAAPISEIGESS
jgi:hypothetical protein